MKTWYIVGRTSDVKELYLIPGYKLSASLNICFGHGLVVSRVEFRSSPSYARPGRAYTWPIGSEA